MLSLGLPPLHIAPFFMYTNADQSQDIDSETQARDYEVPHWMHLSFLSYESDFTVFVDHLYEKNKEVKKEPPTNTLKYAGLEVAPNVNPKLGQ